MSSTTRSPRSTRMKKLVFGAVAVPVLLIGGAGAAQAAELGPVADYIDGVVADTDADLLAIFTALLS